MLVTFWQQESLLKIYDHELSPHLKILRGDLHQANCMDYLGGALTDTY